MLDVPFLSREEEVAVRDIGTCFFVAQEKYMAYDIIIFDFGLMHRVLGTEECVANYLGTRHFYAINFIATLLIQSSYSLGLSVLTMATAPKLLEAIGGRVDLPLTLMFSAYFFGYSSVPFAIDASKIEVKIFLQLDIHIHPLAPLLASRTTVRGFTYSREY
ncbi:hypothetical protein TELCIR_12548 [Teladorsagia circumcincta]|uniref:Uncharacterized protein n=1 Tax=Teladorsagia circumcincta TaxID=45464 RepID=A0A2G9U6G1_TELCI|nr:hypothetical protein TELCIR_12548 [Teladorsagia circumcincta]